MFPGGWTSPTMRERWFSDVYFHSSGIPVLQAYDGRPNEFTRENRFNFNAMYRFIEGPLKGARVGGAYRWRGAPTIGFGVKRVNGTLVPDVTIVQKGKFEDAIDLSLGYSGKSKWLGDRKFEIDLNVRNVLPREKYITRNQDFFTGRPMVQQRMPGTQFIFAFEIEL
jgi:hypothetical protein